MPFKSDHYTCSYCAFQFFFCSPRLSCIRHLPQQIEVLHFESSKHYIKHLHFGRQMSKLKCVMHRYMFIVNSSSHPSIWIFHIQKLINCSENIAHPCLMWTTEHSSLPIANPNIQIWVYQMEQTIYARKHNSIHTHTRSLVRLFQVENRSEVFRLECNLLCVHKYSVPERLLRNIYKRLQYLPTKHKRTSFKCLNWICSLTFLGFLLEYPNFHIHLKINKNDIWFMMLTKRNSRV